MGLLRLFLTKYQLKGKQNHLKRKTIKNLIEDLKEDFQQEIATNSKTSNDLCSVRMYDLLEYFVNWLIDRFSLIM